MSCPVTRHWRWRPPGCFKIAGGKETARQASCTWQRSGRWLSPVCASAIGFAIAGNRLLSGASYLAAIGLIPIAGGLFATWLFQQERMLAARICIAATALILVVTGFGWVAPHVSRHQTGRLVAKDLEQRGRAGRVATFGYSAPGLVFYSQRQIDSCRTPQDVGRYLEQDDASIVTGSDRLPTLRPHLPPGTRILHQERRFLRDDAIVILGRLEPVKTAQSGAGTSRVR